MRDGRLGILLLAGVLCGCSSSDADPGPPTTSSADTRVPSVVPESTGSSAAASPTTTSTGASAMGAAAMGASSGATDPGLPRLDAPEDVAAPPADALRTSSGLASKRLIAGTGSRFPGPTDTVRVNYSGWQTDGTRFDSSVARGSPSEFPLNRVIAGWTEGLQLMVEGEERRFWIPQDLAYGGRQAPYGMLVFDVQLISIVTP